MRCTRRTTLRVGRDSAAGPLFRGGPGRFGRAWLDSDAVVLVRGLREPHPQLRDGTAHVYTTGPRDASAPVRSTSPLTAPAPASARRRGRCLKVEIGANASSVENYVC